MGVIAQSMPEETVIQGDTLAISLSETLGYTIAALRGLRAETQELIEAQRKQIEALQNELAVLKKQVRAQ